MILTAILSVLVFIVLLFLHEMAHILVAVVLKIPVAKIGFTLKPFPHPYVLVKNVYGQLNVILFLAAGFLSTLLLFAVFYQFNFFDTKAIYFGFCIELIFETNPIYSDFVLMNQRKYDAKSENYIVSKFINHQLNYFSGRYFFSLKWYAHLIAWGFIIVILLSKNHSIFNFS